MDNKIIDFSKDEQIIKRDEALNLKRPIYIRTLNVFVNPFKKRFDKHYREKRHHLFIDLGFVLVIVALIIININLILKKFDVGSLANYLPIHIQVSHQEPTPEPKKITSNLTVAASYAYYTQEGEQLGVGSWPAQIGERTAVRVFLTIRNDLNTVERVEVVATLPSDLNYLDGAEVSVGSPLQFNETTHQVSWQVSELNVINQAIASFLVGFTPLKAGNIILLSDVKISGHDSYTNEDISKPVANLVLTVK